MKKRLLIKNRCIVPALKEYVGVKKNKDVAELLGITPTKLANWIHTDSINIYVVKTSFPEIDSNWLMDPDGPVKVLKKEPAKGIPFIPIDAVAGFAPGEFIDIPPAETIYIPEFENLKVEFCVTNKGNSMEPRYRNGDILGCIRVDLDSFPQWGRIFVLDTKQGVLVKRLKPGSSKNKILCVSDNADFPPFEIPKRAIRSVALVVGGITLE